MDKDNFEVMVWNNIYILLEDGKIDFENGRAGDTITYKQFEQLDNAKEFYNSIKLNNGKKENGFFITEEKLIFGENNEVIIQEENRN